jgi:hypothetical protein
VRPRTRRREPCVPGHGLSLRLLLYDCQAFARFLDRRDILNAAGGTDIFQMPPGRVRLTAGTDALRCQQLTNKVLRWYSDGCQTPMTNEGDNRSRDEVLGPPLCRIYESSAVGPLPPSAPSPPSLGVFARRASMLLGWWVRGLGQPTPFFDDRTKAPRAVPRVLTKSERGAVSLAPSLPSYPGPK